MRKSKIQIAGMTCASCAKINEDVLVKLEGMKEASVNYANGIAYVEFDEDTLTLCCHFPNLCI